MIFSSISFIFFLLPIFLFLDFLLCKNVLSRNISLILFSLLFYTWGEGENVFLLILLGCFNFFAGLTLHTYDGKGKKYLLGLFVSANITCLVYYKYLFWFMSLLISAFPVFAQVKVEPQALPLGISFFTFHGISYLIDVYKKNITERPAFTRFLTYFFMFPHLVAGPIVRYLQVEKDLSKRGVDKELFTYGVARFLVGINKKILIANSVAPIADAAFGIQTAHLGIADAWLGALAYTIQIYFDFSGYSDMAIGLAAMAGFHFEENFNAPYRSKSIREFWRRWHISLSTWLRDYLYIPLGGNRCSPICIYRNMIVVFAICGLWHGAQFTFFLWGLMHGALLILERTPFGNWIERQHALVSRSYCLLMVLIGWIFFRADSVNQGFHYIGKMFSPSSDIFEVILPIGFANYAALALGIGIALFPATLFSSHSSHTPRYATIPYIVNVLLAFLSTSVMYIGARNPFIYFNF